MLRSDWVDRIQTRMLARYGSQWVAMWSGIDPAAVRDDWANELDGLTATMLAYGLENLPDRPPHSAQFKAICWRAPAQQVPRLPAPVADPERVNDAIRSMTQTMNAIRTRTYDKGWAGKLQAREQRGEKLTAAQRTAWRNALHVATESAQ